MIKPFLVLVLTIRIAIFSKCKEMTTSPNHQSVICNTLQELDESIFSRRAVHLTLLKNCPYVIPTLADWMYSEWHPYDASLTKEKLIDSLEKRLNDDRIPFTLVVLKHDKTPIGTISLKEIGAPEFEEFSNVSPWLGSLYVIEKERNQGLGEELLKAMIAIATQLGHTNIFVYTSNPDRAKWYLKRGAQLLKNHPFRNHFVTIMQFPLRVRVKKLD